MCVADDLYDIARPVPAPDVEINPAATALAESSIASSKSSPAVVDAEPNKASVVVTKVRGTRSSSTNINTAFVDRPGIAAAATVIVSPT